MAYAPQAERPPTGLTRRVIEDLEAGAGGNPVRPECIAIEVERHHLHPLLRWSAGLTLEPGEEGYEFTTGPYWLHVMPCLNGAHLEPIFKPGYYPKGPHLGFSVELIKQTPGDEDHPQEPKSPWELHQMLVHQQSIAMAALRIRQVENRQLGLDEAISRSDAELVLADLGLDRETVRHALRALEAWRAIQVDQRGRLVVGQLRERR